MKRLFLLLITITCYCTASAQFKVDSIRIYKKFLHAGTTTGVSAAFNSPSYVDTLWSAYQPDLQKLSLLLSRAKTSHHFQRKEVFDIAARLYFDGEKHNFIFADPGYVVDLSKRRTYRIKNADDLAFLAEMVKEASR